jgi:hypothetical protein
MDYQEFRKQYEEQHPASVPVRPEQVRSEYPGWLRGAVLLMFVCAALLSGVHTVPTVHAGIETNGVIAPLVRDLVSLASFVAVELAIFVAAYASLRGSKRTVTAMLIVTFTIALVSNVQSVLKALAANGDVWVTAVGIILGIGAPLIAFMSGEMFVHMHAAVTTATADADATFREQMKAFDAVVLREFRKQMDKPSTVQVSKERPMDVSIGQEVSPSKSTLGHTKVPDASKRVAEFYAQDAKAIWDETLGVRKVAAQLGVGRQTVSNVRQTLRDQARQTNGHGEPS